MSLAGKRDAFTLDDLIEGGKTAGLTTRKVKIVVEEVIDAFRTWKSIAAEAGVRSDFAHDIERNLRLDFGNSPMVR
jgi:serine/threonine-protein kinase HipA